MYTPAGIRIGPSEKLVSNPLRAAERLPGSFKLGG